MNNNNTVKTIAILLIVICIFLVIFTSFVSNTPEAKKRKMVERQFDLYGNHIALCKELEDVLIDKESLKDINTKYFIHGDCVFIIMDYKAKNELGFYINSRVKATYKINGKKVIIKFNEE